MPRSATPSSRAPGNTLVLADYDQIEMRLLAHFSQDPNMIYAIQLGDWYDAQGVAGFDLHSQTARMAYGIPPEQSVPKAQRQVAKSAGFAEVYGAGGETFAATANISLAEAQEFKRAYGNMYPGVARFSQYITKTLRERMPLQPRYDGISPPLPYLDSPYGRRHYVELDLAYKGVNYIIQGTAADVLKDRLVVMRNAGLGEFMCLPVHDEVMLDVPNEQVEDVVAVLREQMPERDKFAVPLTVGVDLVQRWGDKYR